MERVDFDSVPAGFLQKSAVTVGNFDGVHAGHRRIIRRVIERRRSAPSVVITFEPHPREVLNHVEEVPAIFDFEERARLIGELGADYLVKVNFTKEFASRSAAEFVREAVGKFAPEIVVIGHDFRFGKGREGGEDFLRAAGRDQGFEVEAIPAVEVDGEPVSSTRIRDLIGAGHIKKANKLLGAPFHIKGEVVKGHGRGKALGFATANLKWESRLLPREGVYAAAAEWNDNRCPAVINIGDNPTFGDEELVIEAHVMGFAGELYGARMRLDLYDRLRGEIKFDSADELSRQIAKDVEQAKAVLSKEAGL